MPGRKKNYFKTTKQLNGNRNKKWILYGGLSVQQFPASNFITNDEVSSTVFKILPRAAHFYASIGGYRVLTGGSTLSFIEPSVLVSYANGHIFQVAAHCRYVFDKCAWYGGGITSAGTFQADVGVFVGKMKIGYGFEYPLSIAVTANQFITTHELTLTWLRK